MPLNRKMTYLPFTAYFLWLIMVNFLIIYLLLLIFFNHAVKLVKFTKFSQVNNYNLVFFLFSLKKYYDLNILLC